jgi:CBS domain-containing protein
MTTCPYCGELNVEGTDACEKCQQPLDAASKSKPRSKLEQSILRDGVFMLAPRQPIVVQPSTKVADVLEMLVGYSIGCVVVVEDDQPVGIFSERDALNRLGEEAINLGERPISEFMTPSPVTIESDAKIALALHKMDIGGYRHMPIVADGRVTGVISIRDILDYITANLLATAD